MTHDAPNPRQRLIRALLVLGLLGGALNLLLEWVLLIDVVSFDGFWHLTSGRIIHETGQVPRADPICFTTEGYDWINLNWLAQLGVYRLFQTIGFAGPLALASFLFAATVAFCARALQARRADPTLAWVLLLALAWVLLHAYGIRPRLWTFAFLALFSWLLSRPDPDDRFSVPATAVIAVTLLVWNNVHGGFVYGYGLLGMDLLGTVIESRLRGRELVSRRALLLAAAIGVGLTGFAAHPHGFDAVVYALTYPRRFDPAFFDLILELQPPHFDRPLGWLLIAWTVAGLAVGAAARRRLRGRDVVVFVCFGLLAFRVLRGIIPLILLTAPGLAELGTGLRAGRALRARLARVTGPALNLLPAVLMAAVVAWGLTVAPNRTKPGTPGELHSPAVDPAHHPVEAASFIRDSTQGNVLNTYRTGGALGWALYPARRVFIDGRGDLFSRGSTFADLRLLLGLGDGWEELLKTYAIKVVLLENDEPLLRALLELTDTSWQQVYSDETYTILRTPARGD